MKQSLLATTRNPNSTQYLTTAARLAWLTNFNILIVTPETKTVAVSQCLTVLCSLLCNDGLTSAGIVLDEELIQGAPAAAHPHHDGGAQDPHQPQLLRVSKLNTTDSQKGSQSNAMLRFFTILTDSYFLPGICPRPLGTP